MIFKAWQAKCLPHLLLIPIVAAQTGSTIRSWGNDEMRPLLMLWEDGYRKAHSGVRFENKLMGPASAMAGIYTGVADLSWTGHELWKEESMGFEWVFQYMPFGIEVATASLDTHQHGAALVAFVHKDNPLTHLTLSQLDAIFGNEHKRGGKNIRTWGDLGLTGEWAAQRVHPYGYDPETEGAWFFRQAVLRDSYKWNCDLTAFNNQQREDGTIIDAASEILEALARDRFGIAYSKLRPQLTPGVKTLALAEAGGGPYLEPDRKNVQERTYPLTRVMTVYLNRAKGKPVDPKLKEFLRYVLSPEGQQQVVREHGYLPLTADSVQKQLQALE